RVTLTETLEDPDEDTVGSSSIETEINQNIGFCLRSSCGFPKNGQQSLSVQKKPDDSHSWIGSYLKMPT
ncbi:MAG TPA: hypothetical protein VHR47_02680, partial [Bacillota bacterium]|nr:hypothetical protein [Bacillota bacterium]